MEAAGLAIGVIGLSGLFTACIDCFELVQCGRYFGHDYVLLERKFANQRIRLLTWGQACGFTNKHYDTRIDEDPTVRDAIESTLAHLVTLLTKGDDLRQKYGLQDANSIQNRPRLVSSCFNGFINSRQTPLARLGKRLQELEANIKSVQKRPNISRTARWVIEDKQKFAELVQHIKDFIDDLEGFTRRFDTEQCQRELINVEIESIREIPILEAIEQARMDCRDPVANAASFRLHQVIGGRFISENAFPTRTVEGPCNDEWEEVTTNDTFSPTSDHSIQILYRVCCPNGPKTVYFDAPTYSSSTCDANEWAFLEAGNPHLEPKLSHLCGKRKLLDFETYVTHSEDLEFIAFKDYKCDHQHHSDPNHPSPVCESVYLLSPTLCDVLKKVMHHILPLISAPNFHVGAELSAPFVWYYRSREFLQGALNKVEEMEIDTSPVSKLFHFIDESMAVEYAIVDEQLGRGILSWQFLEYLYHPGDVVMENNNAKEYPRAQAFEVHSELHPTRHETCGVVELRIFHLEFDRIIQDRSLEAQFQNVKFNRSFFDKFDDKVPIAMLPILTIKYITNVSRDELIGRGRKLLDCQRTKYVEYTSLTAPSRRIPGSDRFFIDTALHLKSLELLDAAQDENNASNPLQLTSFISDWNEGCTANGLSDRALLLLPSTLWGFNLRIHEWHELSIQDIAPVRWNLTAFDTLLPKYDYELLHRITDPWINISPSFDEEVGIYPQGSPSGLFLIFSGSRGTGKIHAAECIAEKTHRPLYRLTAGSIGVGVQEAKKAISTALSFAQAWGCVLLVEDADTLFDQGFSPRSLVSCLEGFHGIAIIITARRSKYDIIWPGAAFKFQFREDSRCKNIEMWQQILQLRLGEDELRSMGNILPIMSRVELNEHEINNMVTRSMRPGLDKNPLCDFEMLQKLVSEAYVNSRAQKAAATTPAT